MLPEPRTWSQVQFCSSRPGLRSGSAAPDLVSGPVPQLQTWSQASSPRTESAKSPVRKRRDQSTLSRLFNLGEPKSRPPPKRWSTIF
ncbi:hypothetical protein D4764_21G0007340 [Takifugu flavidus]|uniref:Uncharacterized protein n=1 Tax=Takifugu flavidus TaxID=433684 RepID=A0A5C6NE98_9TELE|nr:hypothetical protein D4764_21G0007340 [Takifugu flavidus]